MERPSGEVTESFLDDGAKEPVEVQMSQALSDAVQRAGLARGPGKRPDPHEVTFSSLFIGLTAGDDPVGEWLRAQFQRSGDLDGLLGRFGLGEAGLSQIRANRLERLNRSLRRTSSARAALDEAARLARDSRSPLLDTRHLVAAYLALPTYHVEDFRTLRIDRVAWARDFAAEMAKRHPDEGWAEFPERVFPQANTPQSVAQGNVAAAPTAALDLGAQGAVESVVAALQEADALAGDAVIGPSHVLQAVVNLQSRPDSNAFRRFARLVPLAASAPATGRQTPDLARLDAKLLGQLVRAQRPGPGATSPTKLWGRDLVTASLLADDDAAAIVTRAGRTLGEVREAWFGFVTSTKDDHRTPDEWRAWWIEAGVPLGAEQRTGVAVETAVGQDRLGVEDEARAFAHLILDRKVEAPLSIGLLGDWGSGKSFFIHQIRKEIQAIRLAPRPDLYSAPVEIEFNAWHASDANLWASLVTHIFDEIWEKVSPSAGASIEDAREELLRQVDQAQGAVHAAEARAEAGREAVAAAETELARKRRELGWDSYVRSVTREELTAMARRVGWDKPLETIADVESAAQSLSSSSVRLRNAVNALAERPVTYIALPTVAVAAVAMGLWFLLRQTSFDQQLSRWATGAVGAIGALVTPLKLAGGKLAALAGSLEDIRTKYDAHVAGLAPDQKDRLARRQSELALAEDGVARAKEHLARLIAEHAATDPRRRLGTFLQDRVQSTMYRSQQGIISLVHKDFRKLSEYMRVVRDAPPAAMEPMAEEHYGTAPAAIRPFDRIILYVDDLDRCRPQHVVHMLEAVHLLLALDLFIVVVAVDSRWLSRSLEVHYAELLGSRDDEEREDDDDDGVRTSTPQNYLEKIFQITYALGPMDPVRFRGYVAALAGAVGAMPESDAGKKTDAGARTAAARSGDERPESEPSNADAVTDSNTGNVAQRDPARTSDEEDPQRGRESQAAAAAEAPIVRIDEAEQAFLCALVPLLPTPRIAKRLVNVYRLIKSTRNAAQREEFDRDGRSESCLLVLALLFGRPLIARELLRGLQEAENPFEDPKRTLAEAVRTRRQVPGEPPQVTAEWQRLGKTLASMKVKCTVGECAREVLVVARYSLVTGHDWHTWRR